MNGKQVTIRCNDGQEAAVFSRYDFNNSNSTYEISFEDSYIGGNYRGFFGRLKRAWRAFINKPVVYTGIYCEDKETIRKFLADCISLVIEDNDEIEYEKYDKESFPKGQYGEN